MGNTTCILGATGTIGSELTADLLKNGISVIAIVRNEKKLHQILKERGLNSSEKNLTVIEMDLFSGIMQNSTLVEAIKKSDYVFNCASPKMSWLPFSKINRTWGEPVSKLTNEIVNVGKETNNNPQVIAFCGPEYFKKYDGTNGFLGGMPSIVMKSFIGALRDNYIEASFLLNSDYKKWTVLRCGSIRNWTGIEGDSSKVDIDFHKDKSDYRKGKGKSLVVEDLSVFLVEKVKSNEINLLEKKMPFVYNIEF